MHGGSRAALGHLVAVEAGPAGEFLLGVALHGRGFRNTIAAQVKANIGRLPSTLTEAGEIQNMQ